MNKELEEATERIEYLLTDGCDCESCKKDKKAYKAILNYIENSIAKEKVEEKIIIDTDKLNHSVNGILSEMYKARITLAKELMEGK